MGRLVFDNYQCISLTLSYKSNLISFPQDANGPFGLTSKGMEKLPHRLPLQKTVVQISSGNDHVCMLTENGEIYSVGCGEQGQLGRIAEIFSLRGGRKGTSEKLNFDICQKRSPFRATLCSFKTIFHIRFLFSLIIFVDKCPSLQAFFLSPPSFIVGEFVVRARFFLIMFGARPTARWQVGEEAESMGGD